MICREEASRTPMVLTRKIRETHRLSRETYKLRELEISDALRAQVDTTVSSAQLSCIDFMFKLVPDCRLAKGSQGCTHLCHSLEGEAEKLLPKFPLVPSLV